MSKEPRVKSKITVLTDREFWDQAILAVTKATMSRKDFSIYRDEEFEDADRIARYADALLAERNKRSL